MVDSDDPKKWEYHLREQELPFFITLAHEFLHALNQLERVKWVLRKFGLKNIDELLLKLNFEQICQFNDLSNVKEREEFVLDFEFLKENYENCILAFLDGIIPMQKFLMKYLQLNKYSKLLRQKYKALWQNGSNDDSLDEMTVILGKQRIIGKFEKVFISETTFLREYYKDNTIISWSHDSARSANFWKEMAIILNKTYVGQVLKGNRFGSDKSNIQEVYFNKKFLTISKFFYEGVGGYKCLAGIVNKKVNQLIMPGIVEIIGRKGNNEEKIERFEVFANENLKIRLLPKYSRSVVLNPNCQLEICSNEYEISNISVDDDIFKKLKIGQKSILVIIDDTGLKYKYWFYDGQKEDSSITADSFETILKTKNAEVVLYYNGIEFLRVKKQK
ncbi:MAG: hypothetical protein ACLRFH_03510 [Opitutales bacterium]